MKITKPTDSCVPRQIKTFQFDSFIETSRTYLGMESFDEVVKLCDASTTVTYLESTKQFLQIRKVAARNGVEMLEGQNDVNEFKAEFLVVGKRNPSMPACQMLCQWLEKCLSSSTHDYPCGIMNTPCQCWEVPKRKPGSCYKGGVYVEKCLPVPRDNGRDAEIIISKFVKCLFFYHEGELVTAKRKTKFSKNLALENRTDSFPPDHLLCYFVMTFIRLDRALKETAAQQAVCSPVFSQCLSVG